MPRNTSYLKDMLKAAYKIQEFVQGFDQAQFLGDELTYLAVSRLIEIIGEAANKISDEFKTAHAEIPWRRMIDMRNRFIHGYRDVRLEIVWQAATESIPALIAQLEPLIPPEEEE